VSVDSLRIGLVGYGRFGRIHAEAIESTKGVEIGCVCVGSAESADEARRSLQVEVYANYDEFLEKGRMDVVDIVSPNYLHAQQAIKAMAKGKSVLLEKPIATNIEDARKLVERSKEHSSTVQVGFAYRYVPFCKSFKSSLTSGSIARPTFAKIESWRAPFRTGSRAWRYDKLRVGHQFLEEAIHFFDLAVWYFGVPEKVSGFTDSPDTWSAGRFGSAVALLDYAGGLRVMIADTLNGISEHLLVTVSGEGAMIGMVQSELDGSSASGWIKVREKNGITRGEQVEMIGEVENMRLQIQDFVGRTRAGREPTVTLEDGLRATALNLSTIDAIQSGKVVRPSEL
jgi:myo-inositol 2-dehydrogenase / D-chiro-inositol 1-dehydrogenase